MRGERSNCTHEHYHGKCFVRSLYILVTWIAVMCCEIPLTVYNIKFQRDKNL